MASQPKKFSLVKAVAGNKRSSEAAQQSNGKKIPKVSEMTPVEIRSQRATNDAPVNVCVYLVTHTRMDILGVFAYGFASQNQYKTPSCALAMTASTRLERPKVQQKSYLLREYHSSGNRKSWRHLGAVCGHRRETIPSTGGTQGFCLASLVWIH